MDLLAEIFSGDKVFPTGQWAAFGWAAAWATWADRDVLSAESIDSLPDKQGENQLKLRVCVCISVHFSPLSKRPINRGYQVWRTHLSLTMC